MELDRTRRQARIARAEAESASAAPAFVGRVTSPAGALGPLKFAKVTPTAPFGTEREGGPGSLTDQGRTVLVAFLRGTPTTGEAYRCVFVADRWVAERRIPGTITPGRVTLPNCFCTVPPNLVMTSTNEQCQYGLFKSCTISYRIPPPDLQAAYGDTNPKFFSDQSFIDQIVGPGYPFYYTFGCSFNQFALSRVFPRHPASTGAFFDNNLYGWIVGGAGNTCTPFALSLGKPFDGADATCCVSIGETAVPCRYQ